MIKGVMPGPGITVNGGSNSYPYVPQNQNNPLQGMIRINMQDLQVFDGSTWQTLHSSFPTVELNGETQELLQWVRTQRQLDLNRRTLMEHNPALRKAYEAIKRAEDNFDLLGKFVENDKS